MFNIEFPENILSLAFEYDFPSPYDINASFSSDMHCFIGRLCRTSLSLIYVIMPYNPTLFIKYFYIKHNLQLEKFCYFIDNIN